MDVLKVCGITICVLCICVVFNNIKTEYSLLIRIVITIGIGLLSLSVFYPILKFMEDISVNTQISKYFPVLTKALGVALMVQITSDICKDSGEGSIAQRVETVGKAEIIILCIPLIKDILKLCDEIAKS